MDCDTGGGGTSEIKGSQPIFLFLQFSISLLNTADGKTTWSYFLSPTGIFLCNGIRWPLFYYLHHNSQSLLIIFVHWTQLLGYCNCWTDDDNIGVKLEKLKFAVLGA